MTFQRNIKKVVLCATVLILTTPILFTNAVKAEEEHGDEHAENLVRMTAADRERQGVETIKLVRKELFESLSAPGEVGLNLYQTSEVTPRIPAQVLIRHVRLGDPVKVGDKLVTLSSVQMAEAQGNLIVTAREWKRVENLGRKVVSDRRFVEAQVAAQQARAKVRAFGMSASATSKLVASGDASKAIGAFALYAKQDGTIMRDNFVAGEFVEPGRVLFEISDETSVWVDARLSAGQSTRIQPGTPARIQTSDGSEYPAIVLQLRHQVDEATRTLSARVSVENINDSLHAGQFVTAIIQTGKTQPLLAIPQNAVTLMDGSSQVFLLKDDELTPVPVLLGTTYGEWIEIKSGLKAGDEIAISQVFFLKSMILKSSIGDEH